MKAEEFKRIAEDPEFREHALSALHSVKQAVDEARSQVDKPSKSKKAQKKLKKSKQKDQNQAEAVAAELVDEPAAPEKKKRCRRLRKLFFVAVIGAIVALVVSPDARKAFLDALFGAEEEFQYTSNASTNNGTS